MADRSRPSFLSKLLSRLRGEPPGAVLGKVTRKRLGGDLPDPPRVEEFLADPDAWRVV